MSRRITIGVLIGAVAGVLDVIPMLLQGITWDANLSAFSLWIVVGFMVATSNLNLASALKGIVISVLCLLPLAFVIGWQVPVSLIPIFIITLILGALVGFVFHKAVKD